MFLLYAKKKMSDYTKQKMTVPSLFQQTVQRHPHKVSSLITTHSDVKRKINNWNQYFYTVYDFYALYGYCKTSSAY